MERFIAIVNPAAGGGRAAKLAGPKLAELRAQGLALDVIASSSPGHAAQLAREAYAQGYTRFLAVGGDGTAHEIINGVFADGPPKKRIALGFLPFGTGNSFLRDFTKEGATASVAALLAGRSRPVDLLRLTHHFPVLEQSEPDFFITQEKIRGNGEMRTKDHFLMNSIDAVIDRFVRRGERNRLAFPIHFATGAHVDSGEQLDQRRLAGTVFANDGMNLTRQDKDIDALERLDRAEALADVGERHNRHVRRDYRRCRGGHVMHCATAGLFREAPRRPGQ